MTRIDVRVLGAPHVALDGARVQLGQRQLVLAVRLAIARRVPVTSQRLLDDVWPGGTVSPGALRVAISRLRTVLGSDAVERHQNGFALAASTVVDADDFERLLHDGRDRDRPLRARIASLDSALALWRGGSAFEGVEPIASVTNEAVRLDELREQAIDLRFELRLVGGDPVEVVADLRAALDLHPTRERRAEMLALALYRTGRQVEALALLRQTRDVLRDGLGLTVSPSLSDLEGRILRHDEELLARPRPVAPGLTDVDGALRAAHALTRAGVYEEALGILASALERARALGDRTAVARLLVTQAKAMALSGTGDPDASLDAAKSLARSLDDADLLAEVALARVAGGLPSDRVAALIELAEPLDRLPAASELRVDLLCAAAMIVTFIDNSPAAERLMVAAEAAYASSRSARSEAFVAACRSILASVRQADPLDVRELASQSFQLARQAGDPSVLVVALYALIRAEYSLGNLDAVDALLPVLDGAADDALVPFAGARVWLSRTMNALARGDLDRVRVLIDAPVEAGRRPHTANSEAMTALQHLLLLFEDDDLDTRHALLERRAEEVGPSVWHAVLALSRPDRDGAALRAMADAVPVDDSYLSFVALAAEVAARTGDDALGAWCAPRLEDLGDRTVMVGLGTVVLGFAAHFAGLSRVAIGDLERARKHFERAVTLAHERGLTLWQLHSAVELADVLSRIDAPAERDETLRLLADIAESPVVARSGRLERRLLEVSAYAAP